MAAWQINVVFLELKRRGAKISIGKVGDKEVDFIVRDSQGRIAYYQVAWTVGDEKTLARELGPLDKIMDHNPRYLITTDALEMNYGGVNQVNVIKWLLGK